MRAFIAVDAFGSNIAELQKEMTPSPSHGSTSSQLREADSANLKSVHPHNLHFTLIFLGEISDRQANRDIREKLSAIRFEPFQITYTGVGAFPKPSHARVIWVGVDSEGTSKLVALAGQVIEKMHEIGFVADKPFSPHLTIFRTRDRPVALDVTRYSGRTFGTALVDRFHLKKSDLGPSGPTYSNIYTVSASPRRGRDEDE